MRSTDIPTTIVVASGKGGVGKTRISVDLARALAATRRSVGFLDADISTPNAPQALAGEGVSFDDQPLSNGENLLPVESDGVYLFSQGLHLDDDVAVLRDDQWKAETVMNYIHTVEWPDDIEYLVVDSPPGNGSEIQLVIAETEPDHGFLVTTGAINSAQDSRRTHELFVQAGVPHSLIANMRRVEPQVDYDDIMERVRELDGIGGPGGKDIIDKVRGSIGDTAMPLHDDGLDLEERVGADVVADVPFTPDDERRMEALEPAIEALPQPAVVD